MSESVRRYLESDELPSDYYELIGRHRFDPSPSELKKAVLATHCFLMGYQHHADPQVVERAQRLEARLAEADNVLSIDQKRRDYEDALAEQLRSQYRRSAGEDTRTWQPKNLRFWLSTQNVHPQRLDELVQRFLTQATADSPAPTPAEQTKPSVPRPTTVRPRPPGHAVRGGQSAASLSSGNAIASSATKGATRPTAQTTDPKKPSSDYGMLWIIGSALGTALILLLIVLVVIGPELGKRPKNEVVEDTRVPVVSDPNRTPLNGADGGDQVTTSTPESANGDSSEPREDVADPGTDLPETLESDGPSGPTTRDRQADPKDLDGVDPPSPTPGEIQAVMPHASPVYALAWNAEGKQLATGGEGATVRLWDAASGEMISETGPLADTINTLAWQGNSLAIGIDDGSIILWDVGRKIPKKPLRDPSDEFTTFAWTQRRSPLLAGNAKGILIRLASTNGAEKERFSDSKIAGAVRAMSCSVWKNLEHVACRHLDGTVVIRDIKQRRSHVLLPPDSEFFKEFEQKLNLEEFAWQYALTQYDGKQYQGMALSPIQQKIALTNDNLEVWDLTNSDVAIRERIIPPFREGNAYCTIAWRPDGKMLAVGGKSGQLCVWDTTQWRMRFQRDFGVDAVLALAWNPKQNGLIAVAWEDGSVRVLRVPELATGQVVQPDFDYKQILEEAREYSEKEDWDAVSRALKLLRSYRLSRSEKEVKDLLSFRIDRQISSEVDELATQFDALRDDDPSTRIEFVADGQYIVDLRPEAEAAERARKLMREAARGSGRAK